jgi:hypothetical protein
MSCALSCFCLGSAWAPCHWFLLLGLLGVVCIERRLSLLVLFIIFHLDLIVSVIFYWREIWIKRNWWQINLDNRDKYPISVLYDLSYKSWQRQRNGDQHKFRRRCITNPTWDFVMAVKHETSRASHASGKTQLSLWNCKKNWFRTVSVSRSQCM